MSACRVPGFGHRGYRKGMGNAMLSRGEGWEEGMGYRLGEDKGGRASLRRWWKRGGLFTATRFLGFATLRS